MRSKEDVLQMKTIQDLRLLTPSDYDGRHITLEEIRHILEVCDALWLHSGDPARPHAELTSGKCSDGFVDVLRALRFPRICQIMANELAAKMWGECDHEYDWVIGSDHAGATFSHCVAMWFNAQHDFTEKGPDKTQAWNRFVIGPEEIAFQVEELMTTAGTFEAVRAGIRAGNPTPVWFSPVAGVLVHRSSVERIEDTQIIWLVHYDINVWDPKDCPLCAAGSKRLRPKQHWAELTGRS